MAKQPVSLVEICQYITRVPCNAWRTLSTNNKEYNFKSIYIMYIERSDKPVSNDLPFTLYVMQENQRFIPHEYFGWSSMDKKPT